MESVDHAQRVSSRREAREALWVAGLCTVLVLAAYAWAAVVAADPIPRWRQSYAWMAIPALLCGSIALAAAFVGPVKRFRQDRAPSWERFFLDLCALLSVVFVLATFLARFFPLTGFWAVYGGVWLVSLAVSLRVVPPGWRGLLSRRRSVRIGALVLAEALGAGAVVHVVDPMWTSPVVACSLGLALFVIVILLPRRHHRRGPRDHLHPDIGIVAPLGSSFPGTPYTMVSTKLAPTLPERH